MKTTRALCSMPRPTMPRSTMTPCTKRLQSVNRWTTRPCRPKLPAAAPHPQDDINVVAEIPEHKDEAARAVAVESRECGPSHRNRERGSCHRSGHVRSCCDARRAGAATSRVIALQRRKSDRRRSEAASASERSARRALWAQRRRADRVVQLKRFGNLEQKFHDRVVVISRRAFRHILLVKDSCSARDSVNGTEVAFH